MVQLLREQPLTFAELFEVDGLRPSDIKLTVYALFGPSLATRLVTQMYFPGDPLLPLDPIFNGIPDERARQRLIAEFAHNVSDPGRALGYRFDIVLRGREETPSEVRK